MKDIEVFKKFMGWMQMEISKEKQLEDGTIILQFSDKQKWEVVRNFDEFKSHIETNGMPSFISFDYTI